MADMEPPSFSLGLDLDEELEPRLRTEQHSTLTTPPSSSSYRLLEDNDDDLGPQVADSDPEAGDDPPRRVFKRLRRGPAIGKAFASKRESEPLIHSNDGDDEIEEFSSQEDLPRDAPPSAQYHSLCSSSKVPLHGCGVLTNQSSSQWNMKKREHPLDAPVSAGLETSHSGSVFPKLTVSPLRMFKLLDSDSDDPSVGEDVSRAANRKDLSSKEQQSITSEEKRKTSVVVPQNKDLWNDFCPKSSHIPTPALDDVCEEYFRSVKNKDAAQKLSSVGASDNKSWHQNTNNCQNFEQCWDFAEPLPPAHRYFFHNDPRIRRLVCSRLPNFSPLGIVNNRGEQPGASVVDYMSQFSNRDASKQERTGKVNSKLCSRGKNKSKRSNAEEGLHASEGWVDPKSSATVPKDAGKRRVHANGNGQSAGHWYTSPDGKKVYVSKNGQELTGQSAYRHYRKESGAGFRKSKKKSHAKKRKD